MSRLCRLKTKTHGKDGQWAYDEIVKLRALCDQMGEALEDLIFWDNGKPEFDEGKVAHH